VERGLWLFKSGEDGVKLEKMRIQRFKQSSLDSGNPSRAKNCQAVGPPRSAHLFTENPWGMKARRSVQATERLDGTRWEKILECAYPYVKGFDVDLGSDTADISDTPDENDHAMVDLSW
jgi:hypothetical protein